LLGEGEGGGNQQSTYGLGLWLGLRSMVEHLKNVIMVGSSASAKRLMFVSFIDNWDRCYKIEIFVICTFEQLDVAGKH
jgi:hypothetical protein